jgi:anti-sigma factor RsiW
MRLTLRTLLAYLDDRLPPANAREIGQKISNSPFATELVERIRDVKRRRRLATPSRTQPTIDANLIAEYLDDQLTPELVAKVETQILASDAMLAEVASAHEILGLLRDPVSIEPRLTDRLYGLDPHTGRRTFGCRASPDE